MPARATLSPKQKEIVSEIHRNRNSYIIGANRSGKTYACVYYCVLLAYHFAVGMNGIFGSGGSIGQIYKTILPYWIQIAPRNTYTIIKSGSNPRIEIKYKGKQSTIYLASGDSPQHIEGCSANWAYVDEIQDSESLFDLVNSRLSQGSNQKRIGTGIPQNGWLSELFDAKFKLNNYDVESKSKWIRTETKDNPFISDEYLAQQLATLSINEYRIRGLGLFSANSGSVYSEFNRAIHVSNYVPDPRHKTYIGIDFNISPFASVLCQFVGNKIYVFDEIHDTTGGSTTVHAKKIKAKLESHRIDIAGVIVFPDASGNNSNRSDGLNTDFKMLRNEGFVNIRCHAANPHVADRDNTVRAALMSAAGVSSIVIDPRCKWLIESLSKLEHKNRKTSMHNHIIDAFGYAVFYLKPITIMNSNPPKQQVESPKPQITQYGSTSSRSQLVNKKYGF